MDLAKLQEDPEKLKQLISLLSSLLPDDEEEESTTPKSKKKKSDPIKNNSRKLDNGSAS